MSADQFIAWAMEQPEHLRFELESGHVIALPPERVGHVRTKQRIAWMRGDVFAPEQGR